jgi:murein L,D-transpeptidase YcbB/YkuD
MSRIPIRAMALLLALACAAPLRAAAPAASPLALRHYQLLEQALQRYQELARQPTLTALPPLPQRSLKAGETWSGAPALRVLLTALGDLPAAATLATPAPAGITAPAVDVLDDALVAALRHFQERHGLAQDGVLGPGTYRALTTPLSARVQQIEWTLSSWRALPENPHGRTIIVNIPRFRLYAINALDDPESQWLQQDVVVGKAVEDMHTPTFSADLTHLIFRPYWDVPRSIAVKEVLPAARRDVGYFARNHYELVNGAGRVVPYSAASLDELAQGSLRVRQQPGADNALGAVKFMLPNANNVYLHDTPSRGVFAQVRRAFSHGCIRLSDPEALAEWVLATEPGWTRERIETAMAGKAPLQVNLGAPIRVYIVYGTAIARDDGSILFLEDLYGLEKNRT